MKKMIEAMLIGGVVLTPLFARVVRAQDMQGIDADQPRRTMSAQEWEGKLDLTPSQTERLSSAIKTRDDAVRPLLTQLREAQDKLHRQVDSKADDADVQATLSQIDRLRKGIGSANDQFRAEVATFLTPTQRAKMETEMRSTRGEREYWRGKTDYDVPTPERVAPGPDLPSTPDRPYGE